MISMKTQKSRTSWTCVASRGLVGAGAMQRLGIKSTELFQNGIPGRFALSPPLNPEMGVGGTRALAHSIWINYIRTWVKVYSEHAWTCHNNHETWILKNVGFWIWNVDPHGWHLPDQLLCPAWKGFLGVLRTSSTNALGIVSPFTEP